MTTEITIQKDLKSLINSDAIKTQIARALPEHMTADRFLRVATTALLKTPKLANCTQESFMQSMLDCSSLGLEPDGRRCYLIPYKTTCTLIVGYQGLIELAKRSGEVATWKAETVKEKDGFEWINGQIDHRINWREDRGSLDCVYSIVRMTNGEVDTEVMTLAEVRTIRDRSQGYIYAKRSGKDHPWITDEEEMAKKTVIRRHSKRLTLSPEFHTALEKDGDQIEFGKARHAAQVTSTGEELSTETNPFASLPPASEPAATVETITEAPETLAHLMQRDGIAENELLIALADEDICEADISGLDQLTSDQESRAVENWNAISGAVRKGAA